MREMGRSPIAHQVGRLRFNDLDKREALRFLQR